MDTKKNFMNLLQPEDFILFFDDLFFNVASKISQRLNNEIIVVKNVLYIRNSNYIYENKGIVNNTTLKGIFTKYLAESYNNLNEKQINELNSLLLKKFPDEIFKKVKSSLMKKLNESYISININTLISSITHDNIIFDDDKNGIHFINGRFDLKTKKLNRRTDKDFITSCINRKFLKPIKKDIEKIDGIISKLFRENEAKEYILNMLGASLSADSVKLQRFLVNYGKGGAGKSSLMNMIKYSLGDTYYKSINSDALSNQCKNTDKILNSFNSTIRYYIINEADPHKMKTDILKQIAEGSIDTTKLYRDGSHQININGMIIFISNHMLSFNTDSGINRRLRGYEYKNRFITETEAHENNLIIDNKTIFKKDQSIFHGNFTDQEKNAIFYILAKRCFNFIKNNFEEENKPDCIKNSCDEMIQINDFWSDFIDSKLKKADGKFVSVLQILNIIKEDPSKKYITRQNVISELKDKGLIYNKSKMMFKSKGCFENYVLNDDDDEEEEEQQPKNIDEEKFNKILKHKQLIIHEQEQLIKELQDKIKALENNHDIESSSEEELSDDELESEPVKEQVKESVKEPVKELKLNFNYVKSTINKNDFTKTTKKILVNI